MESRMFQEIPSITPEDFGAILGLLPDTARYHGEFSFCRGDYTTIDKQVRSHLPKDVEPDDIHADFTARNLDRDQLISMYKASYEKDLEKDQPFIHFLRADSIIENDGVDITVHATKISLQYSKRKPDYVAEMEKLAAEKDVTLEVTPLKRTGTFIR